MNPNLVGDGFCNDEINNLHCAFDGGDCCGTCINKNYCLNCDCLAGENDAAPGNNHLVGDGKCQDELNNENCNYDGGDCCGTCVITEYCFDCLCLASDSGNSTHQYIGNGVCNDETNKLECNFDGGDCCLSCTNKEYCTECKCHDGTINGTLDVSCKSNLHKTMIKTIYFQNNRCTVHAPS